MRTKVQGGVVVGFNGQTHVLIRDGIVVWEDDRIVFVGKTFAEAVDRTIQAPDRLIIPGLINMHWHAGVRANWRLTSDHGDPQFFGAGFPNTDAERRGVQVPMSEVEADTAATLNILELLSGGCTTLVEVGAPLLLVRHLATHVERFGVRAYLGPGYRSASYYRDNEGVVQYDWDDAAGHKGLEVACRFVSDYDGKASGRLCTISTSEVLQPERGAFGWWGRGAAAGGLDAFPLPRLSGAQRLACRVYVLYATYASTLLISSARAGEHSPRDSAAVHRSV